LGDHLRSITSYWWRKPWTLSSSRQFQVSLLRYIMWRLRKHRRWFV
jgi:hypothetical protein